jgi:hypothetical protein
MTKANPNPVSYIANIRTALSGPKASITRKIPEQYSKGTVEEVLEYMTDKKRATQDEAEVLRGIEKEMLKQYSVAVNGKTMDLKETVEELFEKKTYKDVEYLALDIEVASIQTGGLVNRLY